MHFKKILLRTETFLQNYRENKTMNIYSYERLSDSKGETLQKSYCSRQIWLEIDFKLFFADVHPRTTFFSNLFF